MSAYAPEDHFPSSPAFRELQPLRIPSGWDVACNQLSVGMDPASGELGGSSLFHATHAGRRFNIDVEVRPEFDPGGAFHMTVLYAPWPRTERGRRRQGEPPVFGLEAEEVHAFETRSYEALVVELEHWIARCTIWTREGH